MTDSNQQYGLPPCPICGAEAVPPSRRGYYVNALWSCGTHEVRGRRQIGGRCFMSIAADTAKSIDLDCPECPGTYGEHYPDCGIDHATGTAPKCSACRVLDRYDKLIGDFDD